MRNERRKGKKSQIQFSNIICNNTILWNYYKIKRVFMIFLLSLACSLSFSLIPRTLSWWSCCTRTWRKIILKDTINAGLISLLSISFQFFTLQNKIEIIRRKMAKQQKKMKGNKTWWNHSPRYTLNEHDLVLDNTIKLQQSLSISPRVSWRLLSPLSHLALKL